MTLDNARSPRRVDTTRPGLGSTRRLTSAASSRLMRNALPVGFAMLIALFVLAGAPNFLTIPNVRDVLRLSAAIMTVSIPMAFLLIMGHVDLSVGSNLALSAVSFGLMVTSWGVQPFVAAPLAVLVGTTFGAVNGLLVTRVGLSPIIVTLGMLTAGRGLALLIAPRPVYGFSDSFAALGIGGIMGIPYLVIAEAAVVVVGWFALNSSPVGRHALAIGVNENAAYLSGIKTKRTIFRTYVLTGSAAALAGLMYAAQLNSAPSGQLGQGFELSALTAVLLGGVAFNGGRGTIRGVVLGVLFLAVLQNGLTLMNVPAAINGIIQGLSLVLAAALDLATQRAEFRVMGRR